MPKSNAERQADYRARHVGAGRRDAARLNTLISLDAATSLEILAACYGVTQRAVLEAALASAAREAERHAIAATGSAVGLYARQLHLDAAMLLRNDNAA